MKRLDDRRWPLAPLWSLLERHGAERVPMRDTDDASMTNKEKLAVLTGWTKSDVERVYRRGWMADQEADQAACSLGFVPSLIWPDWHDEKHLRFDGEEANDDRLVLGRTG